MTNTLYLECNTGISGDMSVAALLDLGADEDVLMKVLDSIPAKGFEVKISRVKKAGIDCCDFAVLLDKEHENHDHDMEYLYGKAENCGCSHEENHEHSHSHIHHHEHKGMKEIREILSVCAMTERARGLALKIFEVLAQAEAKAHGVSPDEVHFHEVGAIDSIVDIVAAAVCLDNLGITKVIIPKLCEGTGSVRCQHGVLPVPVPAVANIIEAHSLPVQFTDRQGELITPTGAAIVAAMEPSDSLPERFTIQKIGMGAGKRAYERPSILRAMLIEEKTGDRDTIYKLESNIDDCSGEALGYVMEELLKAGARDVHYIPVYMKKNRPAWMLNVICSKEDIEKLESIIFRETTTIGIRRVEMERTVLKREIKKVQTVYGEALVKVCIAEGQTRYYPEYESVVKICREKGLPYPEVYEKIAEQCR
ncbi:MAG: nickel pincer cofactor biosynthesis protein LarC [Lachnospiraceae bacterium]|nr:nickel pincer cofactor biosynthesis protein LarC [Lachnospiraceae bacterium]